MTYVDDNEDNRLYDVSVAVFARISMAYTNIDKNEVHDGVPSWD